MISHEIKQCKGCGAPILAGHKCQYCGGMYDDIKGEILIVRGPSAHEVAGAIAHSKPGEIIPITTDTEVFWI